VDPETCIPLSNALPKCLIASECFRFKDLNSDAAITVFLGKSDLSESVYASSAYDGLRRLLRCRLKIQQTSEQDSTKTQCQNSDAITVFLGKNHPLVSPRGPISHRKPEVANKSINSGHSSFTHSG